MKKMTIVEPNVLVSENNTVGVLYNMYKKSNVKNPKFKVGFAIVLNQVDNFGPSARALLGIYKKTNSLKCICCNSSEAYFRFSVKAHRATLVPCVDTNNGPKLLTVDHDILNSLGGNYSISNLNPLCSTCNELRGSRFAGYAEFKYWYDNTAPNKRTTMPAPNFSFIDFKRNLSDGHHVKSIKGASTLPKKIRTEIVKSFRKGGKNPFEDINYSVWLMMERNFVNEFFSQLVYERVRHGHSIKTYEKKIFDYFNFPNGMTDHRKQKTHVLTNIELHISKARQLHRKIENEKRISLEKQRALPTVQEVNKNFGWKNIFSTIRKLFA